ncbi:MAG: RecQ family ATP-dependent DNA helicase [Sphaerochaetaceae bacterium]
METNFDNPDLNSAQEVAEKIFKINNLKPYQILVIVNILENSRITGFSKRKQQLVILPTGAGKSLCFQIPSVLLKGLTIIVYPLIALMNDQEKVFKQHNIPVVVIKGGQTNKQRNLNWEKLESRQAHIIITNPESLIQKKTFNDILKFKIELVVIDEAHVIAEWGKSFRPAYLKMCELLPQLRSNQILAFTATADSLVIKDISKVLFKGIKPKIILSSANRENIIYNSIYTISKDHCLKQLLKTCDKPALVFCPTRNFTKTGFREIKMENKDLKIAYYNAKMEKEKKVFIENWFKDSKDGVLLATNAYGMGIDKKNIRTVIHVRIPFSTEAFLQESGRAGRDENKANSIVLIDFDDLQTYFTTENIKQKAILEVFINSERCRRTRLMELMNQSLDQCTGCDICNKTFDPKIPYLNHILNFFIINGFKYNCESASLLLCGVPNAMGNFKDEKDNLFFGYFNNWYYNDLEKAILQLIKYKVLKTISFRTKKDLIFYNPAVKRRKNIIEYFQKRTNSKELFTI